MPRLSFSLRDVFWLTLVVAMGVGWWVEHRSQESDKASMANAVEFAGAIESALKREGITVVDNLRPGKHRTAILSNSDSLKDLKYDLKVADKKLALLETRLADDGRKVKWVWADGEVRLKIEE
jgi:hypothetical protein